MGPDSGRKVALFFLPNKHFLTEWPLFCERGPFGHVSTSEEDKIAANRLTDRLEAECA